MSYKPRLKTKYKEETISKLKEQLGYSSIMQVPKLKKICLNQGIGAGSDKKIIETALKEMTDIAGQKAVTTKAKRSISNFKLREGMIIGVKVTLRGNKMYEFLDKLIAIAIPRVRDFRGIELGGFDKGGNYTLGIKEQIIFPEVDIDKITSISGMDITFVTTAKNKKGGYALLKELGLPFKDQKN